jgi:N-acetylglutamate synthase-like GNAT family acetyltransferase
MSPAPFTLRAANARDQDAIVRLVRSERLNPNGLHWPGFVVATAGPGGAGAIVGAVQMRHHLDGAREVGSLVVAPGFRRCGLGQRLVATLLAAHRGPVHLVTARGRVPFFADLGFRAVAPGLAPRTLRRQRRLGQWLGGLHALLNGRLPRRLVILERR